MAAVKYAFRNVFKLSGKESLQWYPGHMEKSFAKMQNKIKQMDCVIEVHDARIPFSGRNPNFLKRLIGQKPHVLVLNKKDLIDKKVLAVTEHEIRKETENVVFTNTKDQSCRGIKQVIPKVVDLINSSDRFNRSEETNLRLMVVGVPNVGKSSLINALRSKILHKGKATPVGDKAGVTTAVQNEIKVNTNPPLYMIDTPGILLPRISDVDTGMKLALCSCLNDENVGYHLIADYLLFWSNKYGMFQYVDHFDLEEPNDDILKVLTHVALKHNKIKKLKDLETNSNALAPDLNNAALIFVKAFRDGDLGGISLDIPGTDL